MKKISLNDLPKWSPWPERLLGENNWQKPNRNIQKIEDEYNQEKYLEYLNFLRNNTEASVEDIKKFQLEHDEGSDGDDICISEGDDLYVISVLEAREKYYNLIFNNISSEIDDESIILELGCGYGYNLWMLDKKFGAGKFTYWGGEYSDNAVSIANILFRDIKNISVEKFNYYEDSYPFPKDKKLIIFTSHSIEQIPDASGVVGKLLKFKDQIKTVFHFEPVYELQEGSSLINMIRKKYIEQNDYNTNLLTILNKQNNIRMQSLESNVFGMNPLNPTSIIKWQFK